MSIGYDGSQENTSKKDRTYYGAFEPEEYTKIRSDIYNKLSGQLNNPVPSYEDEKITQDMSDLEKRSLTSMDGYETRATPETIGYAKDEINKTLTGDYDPATSQYYKAYRTAAQNNLDTQLSDIKHQQSGGGRYYSGATGKQMNDARTDITNSLNLKLGELAENERMNRLSVLPQAQAVGEFEENLPFTRAAALQAIGALPRTVEQSNEQNVYNEWLRYMFDEPNRIMQNALGLEQAPQYLKTAQDTTESSGKHNWGISIL